MRLPVIRRIQRVAQRPIQRVTIKELLRLAAAREAKDHLWHAQWFHDQAVIRLAHRLEAFLQLPYVVFCNAHFHEVFQLFLRSFEAIADHKAVRSMEDVETFAILLRSAYRDHGGVVQMLQEGYNEMQALVPDVDLSDFLDKTIVTRIGNRVLAEHFLSIHDAWLSGNAGNCTGVVHRECCPSKICEVLLKELGRAFFEHYGLEPKAVIEGQLDTSFCFIADHLRFMLQEILKNAFRATIESHATLYSPKKLPPVTVEIMRGSYDVTIKVSDQGGGMQPDKLREVWKYGYTTASTPSSLSVAQDPSMGARGAGRFAGGSLSSRSRGRRSIAGYGFGLPLSRVYAQYFGGDIIMQSMHGYGSDVYLNVNHLGQAQEIVE